MDLTDLLSEHLWLVIWLLITLFSFFRKKREEGPGAGVPERIEEMRRRLAEAAGVEEPRRPSLEARLEALEERFEAIARFAGDDRRLEGLVAALGELPGRAAGLRARLVTGDEAVGAEYTVAKLERAASWLEVVVRQRSGDASPDLRAAEQIAELARAPFVQFCRAQGIDYEPRPLVAVRHGGRMERALRAEDLPFTLIAVGGDARRDPRAFPLVAREIGESLFFDVPDLAGTMARGLSLPEALQLPATASQTRPAHVRAAFGPYLADLFADLYATSLFGPAYVEALIHLANQPRARNAFRMHASEQWVASRPPLALRIEFACEALDRLGRVSEAKRLRHRYERLTEDVPGYLFPAADGSSALVPVDHVRRIVAEVAPDIVDFRHPTLEGFRLPEIPGLGYFHAQHAAVNRARADLEEGRVPHAPPLLALAAASLIAAERPERAGALIELALRALRGDHRAELPKKTSPAGELTIAQMAREPRALAQAIALGAALGRRPRPGSRLP